MNETTTSFLEENALRILELKSLSPGIQSLIFPLLNRSVQSTLKILEMIEDSGEEGITYEELGRAIGHHPLSVSQKLNALVDGGYPLILHEESVRIKDTGRCRKSIKKSEERRDDDL